jgi:hypothetical protein
VKHSTFRAKPAGKNVSEAPASTRGIFGEADDAAGRRYEREKEKEKED